MEFLPSKDDPSGPIETIRVNWYYRPRDIQRKAADMRAVYASMHSDTCPLSSLRGKCQIRHRSEIKDIEEYRMNKDCFWFDKMYDRYIQRYYDVIPTGRVINVPEHVKKVLDERWRYVLVEVGRRKELTSAVKTCKKCSQYAANSDSVDCAVCRSTYHMYCVRPVLTKKPARGFAWACGPCSRAQERKMEARNTPMIGDSKPEREPEPEVVEEEEDDPATTAAVTQRSSPAVNEAAAKPATSEQIAQAKLWPFRYLGIHCRVEDALDYDDRIYPRASSRLGTRHQANVPPWHGRPVEYVKAPEAKKKYMKSGGKKELKLSKEAIAAMEAKKAERAKRPKWVMDEPAGYIPRGEDEPVTVDNKQIRTAELQFKMPSPSQFTSRGEDDAPGGHLSQEDREKIVDEYMTKAKEVATTKAIEKHSTNFLDKALNLLYQENYNAEAALARLAKVNRYKDLKEPHLRPDEVKQFESGVAKYGSELRNITKHVGTVPHRHIVRYYYMWKKTPKGRQIWGNFEGRRGKKAAKKVDNVAKLVDDVADDHDDSAFDNDKAMERKRGFTCKFCSSRSSRRWRRAPGVPPGTTVPAETSSKKDKGLQLTVGLCQRCSLLWRKYGIQWEDADEVAKRITQGGNKSWRRKTEEELLAQLLFSSELDVQVNSTTAALANGIGVPVSAETVKEPVPEPAKKKTKTSDKDAANLANNIIMEHPPKKKAADKPVELPALIPEPPKAKVLPCAICNKMDPMGDQHLSCRDCRLTVHRDCYGARPSRNSAKWLCDMCTNDRNPSISTSYECVLCPVTWTDHELMEPPKISHKKKTDREREKERLEKEMVAEAIKLYRQRQETAGKPVSPREPLKRTAGNNWVHVNCAIWFPEIKFGSAKDLEPVEGLESIPPESYKSTCKICKTNQGACVSCRNTTCSARFHVGCAQQAGYRMGFDVTPIKNSRKDAIVTMKLGEESGIVTPVIWCLHHSVPTTVHEIGELTDGKDMNALQVYSRTFKQADLTLTGTARKAAHVQQSVSAMPANGPTSGRRGTISSGSGVPSTHPNKENHPVTRNSVTELLPKAGGENNSTVQNGEKDVQGKNSTLCKSCLRCQTTVSPKWWQVTPSHNQRHIGPNGTVLPDAQTKAMSPSAMSKQTVESGVVTNGDFAKDGMESTAGATAQDKTPNSPDITTYECHRCHFRKPSPSPAPAPAQEPTASTFPRERDPSIQPGRAAEYPRHIFASSPHTHAIQPHQNVAMPPILPAHSHGAPEWRPDYDQRSTEYPTPMMRNGIPPAASNFHSGPPPQPGRLNGYSPSLPPPHPPHPPHYSNGVPPPPGPPSHSYPTHQSPYGPIAVPHSAGPAPPHAANASPYPAAPLAPGVRFSPPTSLPALPPGPPPARMYSVDRNAPPHLSPPTAPRRSIDLQRPTTAGAPDQHNPAPVPDNAAMVGPRPASATGRHNSASGPPPGSGASASPSLKNLLL